MSVFFWKIFLLINFFNTKQTQENFKKQLEKNK
jgi:hypothetical protein